MIGSQSRARTLRMEEKQILGVLSAAELRDLVGRSEIDTVWSVTPDQYGRPVGKRFGARFFVDEVLERQADLPAQLLFNDIQGHPVAPPATVRADPGATVACRPDPTTFRRASWLERTAISVCDVVDPRSGELHPFSPRAVLQRQLARSRSASVRPRAGFELGFYLDLEGALPAEHPAEVGSSRISSEHHALGLDDDTDAMWEIQQHLRKSGVPVEFAATAAGPSQYSLACCSSGLLEAADRVMILKWLVKEVAAQRARSATFMARPCATLPPSSTELGVSLWSADRESALFGGGRDHDDRAGELPVACRWWLGGLLRSVRESTLLLAPTINSYKRFHVDLGRGSAIGWARDRRSVGFRVEGEGERRRVVCSIPGSDANPYLVGALLLAAGLEGMSSRSELPAEAGREASAIRALPKVPQELVEAADLASRSSFVRQVLGEHYVEYLAHCARWEQARYGAAVSSWEMTRYRSRV